MTARPFGLPMVYAFDDRGQYGLASYLRVVDDAQCPREPVTLYIHEHPELIRWHAVIVAAHKAVTEYVARIERERAK